MERYSLRIARSAAKELEGVAGKSDRVRIVKAIHGLASDPRGRGSEKLSGGNERYRVRVGDFRIVYGIDDSRRLVDVVKIGHRREVYRK